MSSTDSPDDEPLFDPRITDYDWLIGTVVGACTFLVGYLTMAAVILVPDGPGDDWQLRDLLYDVGRVHYNAHQIGMDVQKTAESVYVFGSDVVINTTAIRPNETIVINQKQGQVARLVGNNTENLHVLSFERLRNPVQFAQAKPEFVYYLTPVVVLVALGAVVAYLTLTVDRSVEEYTLPAIALAVGYTVAAVLGTFLLGDTFANGSILVVPNLGQTLILAPLYSLLCGAVGSLGLGAYRNWATIKRTLNQ